MSGGGPRGRRLGYLRRRFEALGIRPLRQLGQNFLLDRNAVEAVCRDAEVFGLDLVLEVGPGSGLLTATLAATGARVLAVEYDRKLAALVREETAALPNVEILEADILAGKRRLNPDVLARLDALLAGADGALKCVSNLPYNIASPFVANLCADARPWERGVFMVQLEEAQRFVAGPGEAQYGALSVTVQAATREVCIQREMPPQVFWPRPRVRSAVVALEFRPAAERTALPWTALRRLTAAIFTARRKTLRNALKGLFGKGERARGEAFLAQAGIDPDRRGESLPPAEMIRLARLLAQSPEPGGA